MKDTFLDKLEAVKQQGNYAMSIYYGEEIGCDDSSVPVLERSIKIHMAPVGCIGELRKLFVGTVQEFLDTDIESVAEILTNPPHSVPTKTGWYIWGTDDSVEHYKANHKVEMFAKGKYKK
jgi:hypothetical protein